MAECDFVQLPLFFNCSLFLQGGEKQRVFTGIVTSLHDYFGVVDEEVFFQLR